jgi:hypothetical protein
MASDPPLRPVLSALGGAGGGAGRLRSVHGDYDSARAA